MRRVSGIISFLTDFSSSDPYVACMKGVALDLCPTANLVDISHSIPSFDIDYGSLVLLLTYRYFPPGTVFVAVVDPGVGSSRRPLAIASRNYYFIGPDNGLLLPAAEDDGLELTVVLDREEFFRKPVSPSFHGRDIFTPVAARIACGTPIEDVGSPVSRESLVRHGLSLQSERVGGCIKLRVVYIDKFGNLMLSEWFKNIENLLKLEFSGRVEVVSDSRRYLAVVERVFSIAPRGQLVLYENSFGLAELAVNLGSAEKLLQLRRGDSIELCPP
ncbi:MAG: SAM-dependent chlorinase/fluorinase [Sulfolobales archaeon]|nr:SAM-dependent chlorinase/fluorinase [Sulfolobales archaeon]MDW8083493.1 SAM-dependent chlorinase/fluorinase [Sulfolobales archaeon]